MIKHDEKKRCDTHAQTENVHKRGDLISPEDAEGNGEERAEHVDLVRRQ